MEGMLGFMRARRWTAAALVFGAVGAPTVGASEKGKKPRLSVRAAPRMATSPASIYFTAELQGGDDVEELYCPAIEWDWDDGGRSIHEADCPPYEPGMEIQRRFTNDHVFTRQGRYEVQVRMRRADRVVGSARVAVTIRRGFGEP